jgi:tellurite resistance protein TehA-like permease
VTPPAPTEPSAIATLFPGYFALVMATGIISIAARQQGIGWLARTLFVVAVGSFTVLAVLLAIRLVRFPARLIADLTSHTRGFAFLTIVAATNVVGSASALVYGWWDAARVLWWCGVVLWAVLVYTPLIAVVLRQPKPGMSAINGSWFLLTVSTESIAVLGAVLLRRHDSDLLAFACIASFALGLVLYLIVMTMVFLRWSFQPLEPTEADPPAWIASGAVAITVLAGSNLLVSTPASPRLHRLAPMIEGFVVLAWATATFWFPLMIAIGVWRHVVRRVPLRYHPAYWALVFPIGMYSAATFAMRRATGLDDLGWLPSTTFVLALVAWCLAAAGLAGQGVRKARAQKRIPGATSRG